MSMPAAHLTTNPTLADLLQGFADAPAIEISDISSDSRTLKPGDLFLACGGESSHGLDYVADAVTDRGRRDDVHTEGGGDEGAIVMYSIRGHGDDDLIEMMDAEQQVQSVVGWQALLADAQS